MNLFLNDPTPEADLPDVSTALTDMPDLREYEEFGRGVLQRPPNSTQRRGR